MIKLIGTSEMLLNSLRLMTSRTEGNSRHNRSSGFGKELIILLSHFHSRNPFIENWTKLSNGQKLLDEICGNSKIQNIVSYKHLSIFKRWSWLDDCFKTEMLLWKCALWKENKTGRNTWPGQNYDCLWYINLYLSNTKK